MRRLFRRCIGSHDARRRLEFGRVDRVDPSEVDERAHLVHLLIVHLARLLVRIEDVVPFGVVQRAVLLGIHPKSLKQRC